MSVEPSAAASLQTVAVTAGRPVAVPDAPLSEPIMMASTYVAGGAREYGRLSNPTWEAFETAVGMLEGGRALAYSSGLAAVASLLDLVPLGGRVVAPRGAYNGLCNQIADLQARGRLEGVWVEPTDTEAWVSAVEDADLVWLESPTNPLLEVIDLPTVIAAAREAQAYVAVDNTFATPLRQRPLELGADVVVHSVTKYLSGHSDVVMGVLVTADPEIGDVLKVRRDLLGAIPGPFETWLATRGLRTLGVRLDRAEANAQELAQRLSGHPGVTRVRYPGWGAMVSIEIDGGAAAADQVCASTRVWVPATSLGGVESTLERRRRWNAEPAFVPESLVRLSVGIEDIADLWSDLAEALGTLG